MQLSPKKNKQALLKWLHNEKAEDVYNELSEDVFELYLNDLLNIDLGTLREMNFVDVFSLYGYRIAKMYLEQEAQNAESTKSQHNKWRGRRV